MRSLLANLRVFLRGLLRPGQIDTDMQDEMRFHIDMEAQRLRRRGLSADEAARQAAVAFGGVEKYRGAGRDALGLTWLRGLSTDVKLGARMLRKYPGLTVVGTLALSLAIGAGAAYLEFVNDQYRPTLPFAEGERLIGIANRDVQTGALEQRASWDLARWRDSVKSVAEFGAYASLDRHLVTDDGRSEIVRGVAISASAFHMLRVPPVLGRPLQASDEAEGAAPVAVIGYDLWQSRFAGDGGVIGRTVTLGADTHTIVGVMPQGFGFPVSHELWAALPLDRAAARRTGLPIRMFGWLASGATIRGAQAELSAIGLRASADFPDTHQHLRPEVKGYVASLSTDGEGSAYLVYAFNLFFIGLLGICGANVATLIFARTATRATEIGVRTALGASRARIAGQLFAEGLVLCSISAGIGLFVAYYGLKWVKGMLFIAQHMPPAFWWNDTLSIETLLYATTLAVLGAIVIGVIPAWKATGPQVQEGLKHATTVRSGLKFGGVWTAVVVGQVGLTVIFLCLVGALGWSTWAANGGVVPLAFPGHEFISVHVGMDGDETADAAFRQRFGNSYEELERRLRAEPGVTGVTFGIRLPASYSPIYEIEVAGSSYKGPDGRLDVQFNKVDVGFFNTFDAPIVSGRGFTLSDTNAHSNAVVVDETFVTHALPGMSPIGAQVRQRPREGQAAEPWLEIVGVVRNLTTEKSTTDRNAKLYRPITAGAAIPIFMGVHATNPSAVMSRLPIIAASVDPSLRLDTVRTLDEVAADDRAIFDFFARIGTGIALVALLLAISGVYALMAFTVSRRTPEIAIRLALGGNVNRVVLSAFSRALLQVSLGVIIGCVPGIAILSARAPEMIDGAQLWTTLAVGAGVAAFMAAVTVAACVAPARRALRIRPTDALRAD